MTEENAETEKKPEVADPFDHRPYQLIQKIVTMLTLQISRLETTNDSLAEFNGNSFNIDRLADRVSRMEDSTRNLISILSDGFSKMRTAKAETKKPKPKKHKRVTKKKTTTRGKKK